MILMLKYIHIFAVVGIMAFMPATWRATARASDYVSANTYNNLYPYMNNTMRTQLNPGVTPSQSGAQINVLARTKAAPNTTARSVVARTPAKTSSTARAALYRLLGQQLAQHMRHGRIAMIQQPFHATRPAHIYTIQIQIPHRYHRRVAWQTIQNV